MDSKLARSNGGSRKFKDAYQPVFNVLQLDRVGHSKLHARRWRDSRDQSIRQVRCTGSNITSQSIAGFLLGFYVTRAAENSLFHNLPMSSRRQSTSYTTRSSVTPSGSAISSEHDSTSLSRPTGDRSSTAGPKRAKTATSTGVTGEQQIICALTESRGLAPTVGLAFVNLSTMEAVLSQIVDNQTYVKTLHKLHVYEPTEILVPNTAFTPSKSKLLQVLEANLDIDATVTDIGRKYWNETAGIEYIDSLAFKEDVESIKVSIGGNFFATCCLAAVLMYVDHALAIKFASHSLRIKYEPSDGSMMMDLSTMRSLELIQNLNSAKSKHCLFGLLDHTLTPMGGRMLRGNILQPLIGKRTIEKRYDALDELTSSEELFVSVRKALKSFEDVDRVLTSIVIIPRKESIQYCEQSINYTILIKQYVTLIPGIYEALEACRSELLRGIRELCAPTVTQNVRRYIEESLNEDTTYQKKPLDLRNQRTYAVKTGVNGLLDVARQTYKEANDDVRALLESLADTHNLQLSIKYDQARQFYIVLPASELEDRPLPDVFVNVFKNKNNVECQTLALVKLNQKIVDSHHEVLHMSDRVVQELLENIRGEIAPLFKISEGIAVLDMLASLAHVSSTQNYCRPEISSTMAIRDCRHPLREKVQAEKYVPNDVFAPSTKRLQILTGSNMSGKSTYIRSIALVVIIAQIGCFVPATYASISIRSQIFARVSVDDSSVSNISTFATEMRETAFILRNIDSKSLAIIDELGRGTSTRDGLAIATAVAEALVQSKALVWFVTHFRDLATILSERPGVINMHMKSQVQDTSRMTMLYEVGNGPVEESHYGLALARVAGLPDKVLEVAEEASKKLEYNQQQKRQVSSAVIQARRRKLILGLREQLVQAKEGSMQGEVLRVWLKGLQEEFVRRIVRLDEEYQEARGTVEESGISNASNQPRDTSGGARYEFVSHLTQTKAVDDSEVKASQLSTVPRISASRSRDDRSLWRPGSADEPIHSPRNLRESDDPRYFMSGAL